MYCTRKHELQKSINRNHLHKWYRKIGIESIYFPFGWSIKDFISQDVTLARSTNQIVTLYLTYIQWLTRTFWRLIPQETGFSWWDPPWIPLITRPSNAEKVSISWCIMGVQITTNNFAHTVTHFNVLVLTTWCCGTFPCLGQVNWLHNKLTDIVFS